MTHTYNCYSISRNIPNINHSHHRLSLILHQNRRLLVKGVFYRTKNRTKIINDLVIFRINNKQAMFKYTLTAVLQPIISVLWGGGCGVVIS